MTFSDQFANEEKKKHQYWLYNKIGEYGKVLWNDEYKKSKTKLYKYNHTCMENIIQDIKLTNLSKGMRRVKWNEIKMRPNKFIEQTQ